MDAALRLAGMLEDQGNHSGVREWRNRAGMVWHKISPLTHTAAGRWLNYGLEPQQQAADVYDATVMAAGAAGAGTPVRLRACLRRRADCWDWNFVMTNCALPIGRKMGTYSLTCKRWNGVAK